MKRGNRVRILADPYHRAMVGTEHVVLPVCLRVGCDDRCDVEVIIDGQAHHYRTEDVEPVDEGAP